MVSANGMKCMNEYNYYKVHIWMHDFIQKDEIGIRNKGNMNAMRYLLMYGALLGMQMMP